METDKDHVNFLVSYDATERACDTAKLLNNRPHIIYGKSIQVFCLSNTGKRKPFGLMAILLVV